jgi:hypothetical protein
VSSKLENPCRCLKLSFARAVSGESIRTRSIVLIFTASFATSGVPEFVCSNEDNSSRAFCKDIACADVGGCVDAAVEDR